MSQQGVKRVFKWLLRVISFIVIIIVATLTYSTIKSLQREATSIEELAPETGKFILVDGVSVFIQELGPEDGRPVILVHGTGSWSEIWRETMIALAENGYRAIAIDIPPFGFSEKLEGSQQFTTEKQGKRINAVLEELNIDSGVLVGHSVGGRPTLEALLINQERIDRLVLVDVALGFSNDSLRHTFSQNDPGFLLKFLSQLKPIRNAIFRTFGTNPIFTKSQLEAFVYNKSAIKSSHIEMLQKPLSIKGISISNADWFEYLIISSPHQGLSTDFNNFKAIDIPTLIIWGDKDDITPLWQGTYLTKLFQNSRLEIMKDVGHIPYIEDTERFNEVLINFLNEDVD
jgi:pimeloyl-ACP methyl ester carboxylesterase